jgi:fructoselysine-6-P-deglycase FrlB-like protein
MPRRRDGPPYHMTEMIESEPALAGRILDRLADPGGPGATLGRLVREASTAERRILVTGCGTSEHAALAVAEILRDALRSVGLPEGRGAGGAPLGVQAFEAALEEVDRDDLVVGVSHEGATWATNRVLDLARGAGATTALITVSARSPGAALADLVVTTEELDTSWCHTVGYLSPIVAAAAIAGHLQQSPPHREAIVSLVGAGLDARRVERAEGLAAALAHVDRVVVVGSGADRTAARELTLKIEEGTHVPAAMRDLETLLHGHLAGMDARTGVVLLLSDRRAVEERATRARTALAACREISVVAGAIVSAEVDRLLDDPELTPAGRVVVPDADGLPAPIASLLATAVPLQLLTERMARARGVDPDPIRRDDPAYLRAAEA